MLEFVKGDMFDATADIRVNTVNCVGVMGAGVALAFKQRYPDMFRDYQRDCKEGRVVPGRMHVWKSLAGDWVVNFPTKRDWREPSRYDDIDAGLDDLRKYLEEVGPVKVALPALGCGNGGLDWGRVSQMITNKLGDLDAHVLVFEPSASRRAGNTAKKEPDENERRSLEELGYELIAAKTLPALDTSGPLYALGGTVALSRPWIALMPSRDPGEREMLALKAIAAELSRFATHKAVGLLYGTKTSEDIAALFLRQGVDVVMLLPFGALTRKALARRDRGFGTGSLTLLSAAPANGKWSRQLFAQTMEILQQNAQALLLSDPEPEWLASKGLGKWEQTAMSYVRYETMPSDIRDALAHVGARPIGRRSETGTPNIDFLFGDEVQVPVEPASSSAPLIEATGHPESLDASPGHEVLTLQIHIGLRKDRNRVLEILSRLPLLEIDLSIRLSQDATDADRQELMGLGFAVPQTGDPD